jgi:EAL and modified HD-GYP domain-containing signal transduction protein
MTTVLVGRQPIYTRQLDVFAYELLFRNGTENKATFVNGDEATSQVILHACVNIGLENLVGQKLAFINMTRAFILSASFSLLPAERIVVEVLENTAVDAKLLDALQRLAAQGYIIALDDFIYHDHLQPLLELADIVKIDVHALDRATVQEHVTRLRRYGVKLLAEKVETAEDFAYCQALGFDYFQGYFLGPPYIVIGQSVEPENPTAPLLKES